MAKENDYPRVYPAPQATVVSMGWRSSVPADLWHFHMQNERPGVTSGQFVTLTHVQPGPQGPAHLLAQSQQQHKASCQPAQTGYNGSNEQRGFKLK